jgi:transaldolase
VNTMPPATLDAFRDHGIVARTVAADAAGTDTLFAELAELGIALDGITDTLLADGLTAFQRSFDTLIAGLDAKVAALGAR